MPLKYDRRQDIVLNAANAKEAKLLISTVSNAITTQSIVDQVRRINPSLHITAMAEGIEQMKTLHEHGVYEVVQPEFEASLEITRQALLHLNISSAEIHRFTDSVRKDLYSPLYQNKNDYETLKNLQNAVHLIELNWFDIPLNSIFIGKKIKDLEIRSITGVSIVGVMRNGILLPNPDAGFSFANGDLLAVIGNTQQLSAFQEFMDQES